MEVIRTRWTRRIKARRWPLGASRLRLFVVLRNLGLGRDEIEARLRSIRSVEVERAARRMDEQILRWICE